MVRNPCLDVRSIRILCHWYIQALNLIWLFACFWSITNLWKFKVSVCFPGHRDIMFKLSGARPGVDRIAHWATAGLTILFVCSLYPIFQDGKLFENYDRGGLLCIGGETVPSYFSSGQWQQQLLFSEQIKESFFSTPHWLFLSAQPRAKYLPK